MLRTFSCDQKVQFTKFSFIPKFPISVHRLQSTSRPTPCIYAKIFSILETVREVFFRYGFKYFPWLGFDLLNRVEMVPYQFCELHGVFQNSLDWSNWNGRGTKSSISLSWLFVGRWWWLFGVLFVFNSFSFFV